MSYAQNGTITANTSPDYNTLRILINAVYADNSPGATAESTAGYGYGKTAVTAVAPGDVITAAQWNALFNVVETCAIHTGTSLGDVPSSDVAVGSVITAFPNATTGLIKVINNLRLNKFNIAVGQYTTTTNGTKLQSQRTTAWIPQIVHEFTVDFGSYNNARYFFNSSSRIHFKFSRTGGTVNGHNTAWSTMMTDIDTVAMNRTVTTKTGTAGTTTNTGFYNLTATYQNIFTASPIGYPTDTLVIQAKSNATFGTTGVFSFKVIMTAQNAMDGTITSNIDELRSTGAVVITSPTFASTVDLDDAAYVNVINAVNDAGTIADGTVGGVAVANVLANDTFNGGAASLPTITLTQQSTTHANVTLNTGTGAVNVAAVTPQGIYTVVYRAAETGNLSNYDEAIVTVTVDAAVPDTIDAVADTFGSLSNGLGGTAGNVLTNDLLNGSPATLGNVTLTQVSSTTPGVYLDVGTGNVIVAPGAAPGAQSVTYQICEIANPANCDTAVASVTVTESTVFDLTDGFYFFNAANYSSEGCSSNFNFESDGTWEYTAEPWGDLETGTWLISGSAANYEISFTYDCTPGVGSCVAISGGRTASTWYNMGSGFGSFQAVGPAGYKILDIICTIRHVTNTSDGRTFPFNQTNDGGDPGL